MTVESITLTPPAWLHPWLIDHNHACPDIEQRMQLCIELAAENIAQQTGGPFGAIIFDIDSNRPLTAGVNRVVPCAASIAHAEIMAITSAQQQLGEFSLGSGHYELATSCEPCAMCFGAIPWSGIRHLICGARDADARAIGFDEGPKMENWQQALEQRGITVATDICRQQAARVLQQYAAGNGTIYNASGSPQVQQPEG